jgi:putative ABC transport system permease protein
LGSETSVPPLSIAESVRREILAVDAAQPVANIRTMDGILSRSVAGRRFNLILLGVFAALALTLAVMGIYGVMSYAVTQRSHELGIRMALGATTADTIRLVLRESLVLSGIGAVIGIACALGLTRLLTRMLYGVRHFDPVTFVGVTAVLLVAALAASYVPARRATQVDPVNALRLE